MGFDRSFKILKWKETDFKSWTPSDLKRVIVFRSKLFLNLIVGFYSVSDIIIKIIISNASRKHSDSLCNAFNGIIEF